MGGIMSATVDTPRREYIKMRENIEIIHDEYCGTRRMIECGEKYLPRDEKEPLSMYKKRLTGTFFHNAIRLAVRILSSKPFTKPVQIMNTTTPELVDFAEDVTGDGVSLHTFAHDLLSTLIRDGVVSVLVDFPAIGNGLSLAEERAINARPYFVKICAEKIFNWKVTKIGGISKITQIRMYEEFEDETEWGVNVIPQIRVIDLNRVRIYRKPEGAEEFSLFSEDMMSTPFDCVPIVTFYTQKKSDFIADSPLEDLAYANLSHWRKSANLDFIESTQFPILFGKKLTDDPDSEEGNLSLGVMMMVHADDANADLQLIEPTGSSIKVLRESLNQLEENLAKISSFLLQKTSGTKTATETAVQTAEATSELQAYTRNLEEGLENALVYAGMWMGISAPSADIEIFDDFGSSLSSADMALLAKSTESGLVSEETFLAEAKKRGLISDSTETE